MSWPMLSELIRAAAAPTFEVGDIVAFAIDHGIGCGVLDRLDAEGGSLLTFASVAEGERHHFYCSVDYLRQCTLLISRAHRAQRPDWLVSLCPELVRCATVDDLEHLRAALNQEIVPDA